MTLTGGSLPTSRVRPRTSSRGKRAPAVACGSTRTAITRCTPRRYGNGGSGNWSGEGRAERPESCRHCAAFQPRRRVDLGVDVVEVAGLCLVEELVAQFQSHSGYVLSSLGQPYMPGPHPF